MEIKEVLFFAAALLAMDAGFFAVALLRSAVRALFQYGMIPLRLLRLSGISD